VPSPSVIGAVLEKVAGLTLPAGTTVWFDESPMRTAAGPVLPPYVVLQDDGTAGDHTFEGLPWELTRFRLEVYARSLAEADAIALAIRFNGQPIASFAGLDFGTLPLTVQHQKSAVWEREQRFQEPARAADAEPVFRISMTYRVEASRPA
jgi:hypothetical protein